MSSTITNRVTIHNKGDYITLGDLRLLVDRTESMAPESTVKANLDGVSDPDQFDVIMVDAVPVDLQ